MTWPGAIFRPGHGNTDCTRPHPTRSLGCGHNRACLEVGVGEDQARPLQGRIGRFAFVVALALLCGLLAYGLTVSGLYVASNAIPGVAGVTGSTGPAAPAAPSAPDPGVFVMMQSASVVVNSIAATLGTIVTAVVSVITLKRTRTSPAPPPAAPRPLAVDRPGIGLAADARVVIRRQPRGPHRRPPSRP